MTYARAAVLLTGDERMAGLADGSLAVAVADGPGPVLDAAGADRFLALRRDDVVIGGGQVSVRDPIDPTRGLGDVALADDLAVVASDALLRWQHAERVGRVVLAAEGLGTASRALELGVEYARERQAFGRAIGSYQAVKHALVDVYVHVEQLRSLVWWARLGRRPGTDELPWPRPPRKAAATTLEQAAETLIQVHGGIGFTWEHDAHLFWRRAKVDRLLPGDDIGAFGEVARPRDGRRGRPGRRRTLRGRCAMTRTVAGQGRGRVGAHHLALLAGAAWSGSATTTSAALRGTWHSSGEIMSRARRVATGLAAMGVEPGDRVVVMTMNTSEVFVAYHAIWRAGAVVTPVIFPQTPAELRHIWRTPRPGPRSSAPSCCRWSSTPPGPRPLPGRGRRRARGVDAVAFASLEEHRPARSSRARRPRDGGPALPPAAPPVGPRASCSATTVSGAGRGMDGVARTMGTTGRCCPPLSHAFGLQRAGRRAPRRPAVRVGDAALVRPAGLAGAGPGSTGWRAARWCRR